MQQPLQRRTLTQPGCDLPEMSAAERVRKSSRGRTRLMVLIFALAATTACTAEPHLLPEHLIPLDASDVVRAPDIPWLQLSFRVTRNYPKFAFDENTVRSWKTAGWRVCDSAAGWSNFVDQSRSDAAQVHQRIVLLRKQGEMITLVGRYLSDAPSGRPSASGLPTSSEQFGILIRQNMPPPEVEAAVKSLGLICE